MADSASINKQPGNGAAYLVCVPHVPFITMQSRDLNAGFWQAYETQASELRKFDPEIVFVFGADHYEGQHMRSMPSFMIGQAAEAIDDRGGFPGLLNVPCDVALACAEYLMHEGFDVTFSHAMQVDHGFSSILHHVLGAIDARPVVPIFINALCHPRPSFKRCRQFGEAVGRFSLNLRKRVAFLGSGGLSHETGEVFPQANETSDKTTRDFLIHGGAKGDLSREQWHRTLNVILDEVNALLLDRVPDVGSVNHEWDQKFIKTLTSSDITAFDNWDDEEVFKTAGNSAGEVREWIAAAAAASQAGASRVELDYYEAGSFIGVAAVVVHASS